MTSFYFPTIYKTCDNTMTITKTWTMSGRYGDSFCVGFAPITGYGRNRGIRIEARHPKCNDFRADLTFCPSEDGTRVTIWSRYNSVVPTIKVECARELWRKAVAFGLRCQCGHDGKQTNMP